MERQVGASRSGGSGRWVDGRGLPKYREHTIGPRATLFLVVSSLLVAVLVDLEAPPTYLMTPLYAVPILIAAHRWPPGIVGVTGALIIAVNLVSAQLQATPLAVWPFYTSGLVVTVYLAVSFARQRQETTRHAHAAEKLAEEAVAARQQLQEFTQLAAHDLATPLAAVLGYVQLMLRSIESSSLASQRQYLQTVESAAVRMRRLVDDLRDAARVGAGQFEVRRAPMDLVGCVRQVVDLQQSTSLGHHLLLDAPERLEGSWDRERLGQLVANLVSNAIKYSPEGGEVRVSVRPVAGEAIVSVSDHGIGIPPDHRQRLFQPFSRLEQGRALPGSGLGLYICKGIAEAHGGRIWLESDAGQGSTFSLALPLGRGTPRAKAISPTNVDGA